MKEKAPPWNAHAKTNSPSYSSGSLTGLSARAVGTSGGMSSGVWTPPFSSFFVTGSFILTY